MPDNKNTNDHRDKEIRKILGSIDTERIDKEIVDAAPDKFRENLPENWDKLPPQEKTDVVLQGLEQSIISQWPSIESLQKELDKVTTVIETDFNHNNADPLKQKDRINVYAGKVKLVVSNEGGRVISFDNKLLLEKYRKALAESEKSTRHVDTSPKDQSMKERVNDAIHSSRTFE